MTIIDAQIHLWDKSQAPSHHRQTPFSAEDAIAEMDAAGVDVAINHPPMWYPDAAAYANESARRHPTRFGTLGWLRLDRPEAPDQVRHWRSQPGMIGLRFLCITPDEINWPTDGTMEWLWPLAQELRLPVALCGPILLPHVERIATQFPDLKLTIDHLGFVGFGPGNGLIQADGFLSWSRFPNVSVKLTGAPGYAQDEYPFRSMHDVIHEIYDAYGPERLFWGSDITRLKCSWRQCLTMFTEELPWLTEADKTLIMGEAFSRWFDWSPPRRG